MPHLVASITGVTPAEANEYILELERDTQLRDHILRETAGSSERFLADQRVFYGRRLVYYALIRIKKPRVLVESGVEKGLGACVCAAALKRNAHDGYPGKLYPLDINETSGYLVKAPYDECGPVIYGDGLKFIEEFAEPIDFFIHDTMPSLEKRHFDAVRSKLSPDCVVCNTWHTQAVMDFAEEEKMHLAVFVDESKNHWYQGSRFCVLYRPLLKP